MKTAKKQSVKSGLICVICGLKSVKIRVNLWATFAAVLLIACETREEPIQFKLDAEAAYTFSETADAASFSVTSNIPWKAEITDGNEWCSVTPGAAKGDGKVEISVTANTAYLLERTAVVTVTAAQFSKQITVTQAPPPCPAFSAGSIAATGQTIFAGETPAAINNVQPATGGDGIIAYQWYKNANPIAGATATSYTPPPADAATVGATTYTRRAKDNSCYTTLTPSAGSWVLTVAACNFNAGAIASTGQSLPTGGAPAMISSTQPATGGDGVISYQWYKNSAAISGATAATYTPPPTDAMTVGAATYTRRAKDNTCNTDLTQSAGSWILTVTCNFNAGAIATTGQTVTVGGTPVTINSTQNAGSNGTISYQWYKNGNAISGATAANYTPPQTDAATPGATTYTRHAKDNTCNTTLTQSAGSWILTVTCSAFNAGAIATAGQTVTTGGTPQTIHSVQGATGSGTPSYQWYKNGTAISGATAADYTPAQADANTIGAYTYTRRAKDNTCNTTLTPSAGSWILTVIPCNFNAGAIATTGQTIIVGSTPTTINSTQNATGGDGIISYQWYKNGATISGATAASYTPAQADANTIGAYTYTRRAKDNTCNPTLTPSAGSWVLTVSSCTFNAGAIATTGQTICNGNTVNTITSAMDATGGDRGDGNISYQWRRNGSSISNATASAYNPEAYNTTAGAHTFTRWAYDGGCNTGWVQSAGAWVLTVHPAFSAGSITTASGFTLPGTAPSFTVSNATLASGGAGNITYQWRRSGTSSATLIGSGNSYLLSTDAANYSMDGTYYFTRWAHDATCNTSFVQSGGIFTLTVVLVPPDAGSFTWTCGAQTWSGMLRNPAGCAGITSLSDATPPPAQYKDNGDTYGYYYNWSCVNAYATTLCPSPWRVPTRTDFETLVLCTNGSTLPAAWGRPGYALGGDVLVVGAGGYYWSNTATSTVSQAYSLGYMFSDTPWLALRWVGYGQPVRCVR